MKKAPLKKKKKAVAATKPKPAQVEDDDTPPPTKKRKDDHADWRSRVAKEDLEEANAPSKAPKFVADRGLRSEDLVNETQGFLKSLTTSDKIALYGSIGMAFWVCMPWKQTAEQGAMVGIFSSGVLVLILSAVAMARCSARTKVGGAEGTLRPLLACRHRIRHHVDHFVHHYCDRFDLGDGPDELRKCGPRSPPSGWSCRSRAAASPCWNHGARPEEPNR